MTPDNNNNNNDDDDDDDDEQDIYMFTCIYVTSGTIDCNLCECSNKTYMI